MLSRLVRPVSRVAQNGARRYHKEEVPFKFPTMDELPIPQGPWQELHDKRQKRYNIQLIAGVAIFTITIVVGRMSGAFWMNAGTPPGVDFPYNDYSK